MNVVETPLSGVLVIEPRIFRDDRGHFSETFQEARYAEAGIRGPFVQDNLSRSRRGTLRGLHFQDPCPQGKLVSVTRGRVFDVAVDIRRGSSTFGRWFGTELGDEDGRQLWVPPGFAHGFCALSEWADLLYKCTELYVPSADKSIAWNDPELAIPWPVGRPLLSPKDAKAPRLRELFPPGE
jgi:dTDP-4-dehydrorhamnose 3,5-epimerase